jgi:hypothetical protein
LNGPAQEIGQAFIDVSPNFLQDAASSDQAIVGQHILRIRQPFRIADDKHVSATESAFNPSDGDEGDLAPAPTVASDLAIPGDAMKAGRLVNRSLAEKEVQK